MIDAKTVFNMVANKVRAEYHEGYVYLTRKPEWRPEHFPYCYMTQIEKSVDRKTAIGNKPVMWNHGYEWQLASNKEAGALDELEAIEKIIVDAMLEMGFSVVSVTEVPNLTDPSIARKVLRFTGTVGNNGYIYTRR